MPPNDLTTPQVATLLGVPYTTLLKWRATDRLLHPTLGLGGRRGGDRWPRAEVALARIVARLREADLPLPHIRAVLDALRLEGSDEIDAAVYLAVYVRHGADQTERRVALLAVDGRRRLNDATQLSLL